MDEIAEKNRDHKAMVKVARAERAAAGKPDIVSTGRY
jgi:hypothetical protein